MPQTTPIPGCFGGGRGIRLSEKCLSLKDGGIGESEMLKYKYQGMMPGYTHLYPEHTNSSHSLRLVLNCVLSYRPMCIILKTWKVSRL